MFSKLTLFSMTNKKGFTLIELLMIIAIIGVLTTIAIKTVAEETKKANDTQAISLARNLLTAMETQTPETGATYSAVGDAGTMLQWPDGPAVEIGKNIYVWIAEDDDGDAGEGKWQVYVAHIGGKLGFYFWVPNDDCLVEDDDKVVDSGGNPTPADRIVPSFADTGEYVYTAFRDSAIP